MLLKKIAVALVVVGLFASAAAQNRDRRLVGWWDAGEGVYNFQANGSYERRCGESDRVYERGTWSTANNVLVLTQEKRYPYRFGDGGHLFWRVAGLDDYDDYEMELEKLP